MTRPAERGPRADDEARRAVLEDVRRHLRASPAASASSRKDEGVGAAEPEALASGPALVERFREAVEGVAGHCVIVGDVAAAVRAVREVLDRHRPGRIAVSDAPLARRVLEAAGTDAEIVGEADTASLFHVDVGITTAQWAIAETGTLVLDGDAERHRFASLLPPVHVALVSAADVRLTIGSVLAELARRRPEDLSRCVTFITGPSRTSDIELTLAIGVHGPGALHVIVIGGAREG